MAPAPLSGTCREHGGGKDIVGSRDHRHVPASARACPHGPRRPAGRDPKGVADILTDLTREAGWDAQLAREDVVLTWNEVAGAETARHTRPVGFVDGILTVQADSTAWARQLQNMRSQILTEIIRRFPDAGVESVRFIGPDVPSWKWGPRAVPGRGPRDTYG